MFSYSYFAMWIPKEDWLKRYSLDEEYVVNEGLWETENLNEIGSYC